MVLCTADDEICKAIAIWRWGTLFLKYPTIFLHTLSQIWEPLPIFTSERLCLSNGAFPLRGTTRFGTARYGTARLGSGQFAFPLQFPAAETVPQAVEEEGRDVRAGVMRYLNS